MDVEDILNTSSPTLPDYCNLGARAFVVDGNSVNKVVYDSQGTWRPMGAREQAQPLSVQETSAEGAPLQYGSRVTYAVRRVVVAGGVTVNGGLSIEYAQLETVPDDVDNLDYRVRTVTRTIVEGEDASGNNQATVTTTIEKTDWNGDKSVSSTTTTYFGTAADVPEPEEELGVFLSQGLTCSVVVMPYELDLPAGCEVRYELFRSKPANTELLYLVATLSHADVLSLSDNTYQDSKPAEELPAEASIDLASDGWDMTIPPVRYIRPWKGALLCGGAYKATIQVAGAAGEALMKATPAFRQDDVGSYVSVEGEPYTYQIMEVDDTGVAVLDAALAGEHENTSATRWRDGDVVYVSRPLPDNIEVYSAEYGRLLSNQGSTNVITGIAVHGFYGYVFREQGVEIVSGTPASPELEPLAGLPGCRSHATIADSMSPVVIYYAGINGVWSIAGTQANRLSDKIDAYLTYEIDHSQDEYCHAVYDPSSRLYYLFLFDNHWQELGIRMPNVMLTLDIATGAWTRGELSASRSGLFRNSRNELRPVMGIPGGVALLGVGNSDGDVSVSCRIAAVDGASLVLDVDVGAYGIVQGQPVHIYLGEDVNARLAVRRLVKAVHGNAVELYGELPDGVDVTGCLVDIGEIRWWFATPEVGLSGDFDRVLRLDALAIAHRREARECPVVVCVNALGGMDEREPDFQRWTGVFDFSHRSVSRVDGKTTGIRSSSMSAVVSGRGSPAVVKGIRIETTRVAR